MKIYLTLSLLFSILAFSTSANSSILEKETKEVTKAFGQLKVKERYNYCIDKAQIATCGSLVTYEGTKSFSYNFSSLERQVGATVYYLEKENGAFKNYLDEIFDGVIGIDKVFKENSNLKVTFDNNGFPTIKSVYLVVHGTTKYVVADFTIEKNRLFYAGFLYDNKDTDFKQNFNLEYKRFN